MGRHDLTRDVGSGSSEQVDGRAEMIILLICWIDGNWKSERVLSGDVCKILVQLQSECVEEKVIRCLWIVSTLLCKKSKKS